MGHIQGLARNQLTLFPDSLDDYISAEQQAIAMSMFVAITLVGLGGAWIPLWIMPEFLRTIGHSSPVAWAIDGFNDLFFNIGGPEDVIVPVLFGLSAVLFIIGISRFNYE